MLRGVSIVDNSLKYEKALNLYEMGINTRMNGRMYCIHDLET